MEQIFAESYFVSAGDSGPEGELSLTVLISRIIETATFHANSLHIGNPDMKDLDGGWVLGRLTIQMEKYPPVNTEFTLSTWIEGWNRMFSTRCFEIKGKDGYIYGYARTVWMVINLMTHENLGLSHLSLPEGMTANRECPIPVQGKHRIPDSAPVASYVFKYSDLDFYRHVNTLKWTEILLDRYTLHDFDENFIHRFEISFMKEGRYGMKTEIRAHKTDDSGTTEWAISCNGNALVHSRITLRHRQR